MADDSSVPNTTKVPSSGFKFKVRKGVIYLSYIEGGKKVLRTYSRLKDVPEPYRGIIGIFLGHIQDKENGVKGSEDISQPKLKIKF
jgi:hypothetical protein